MAATVGSERGVQPMQEAAEKVDQPWRKGTVLDVTPFKVVYRATHEDEPRSRFEWHEYAIRPGEDAKSLLSLARGLLDLQDPHLCRYFDAWLEPQATGPVGASSDNGKGPVIVIICERMGDAMEGYCTKIKKSMRRKVIRRWSLHILKALAYLHEQDPPIVHKHLTTSVIKVYDKGTSAKVDGIADALLPRRCTLPEPYYYPPEVFSSPDPFTPAHDVYTFGMTLLAITTLCLPYEECPSMQDHHRALSSGVLPEKLARIAEPEAAAFIAACLAPAADRPTARALQQYPFITNTKGGDIAMRRISEARREALVAPDHRISVTARHTASPSILDVTVVIDVPQGQCHSVNFAFGRDDNALSVVQEMQRDVGLPAALVQPLVVCIADVTRKLLR